MFKKYIYLFIWFTSLHLTTLTYWAASHQSNMLPWDNNGVITTKIAAWEWVEAWELQLDGIFTWISNSIESLLPIIAVGVFLFVGIRIALAKWNAEEFKKAWTQLAYAVIGIFVVWVAWAAVKLVAGLNI